MTATGLKKIGRLPLQGADNEMFGRAAQRKLVKREGDGRLRWLLLATEKLEVAERLHVLRVIDASIQGGQLKRKAVSRA